MGLRKAGLFFASGLLLSTTASAQLPPLPSGWPARVEIGAADSPGGAAALRATAPFLFRYQYLAGGVNTSNGWATWNANGDFPTFYIQDSIANGMIPVFTYYQLLQSTPAGGSESDADFGNLNNTATMTAYYNDLILFFQKAGAFPAQRVVLHVEPDFWGYMEQRSTNDNAAGVPAKVSETGIGALQGLPSTVAGFALAVVKLRDTYAPNVTLAYHLSVWGTNFASRSEPPDARWTRSASAPRTSAVARRELRSRLTDIADRDAAFKQFIYGDGGISWWDAEDFRRSARFLGKFSTTAGKRLVMWQLPLGNTRMRAQDNTWGHYQDNRVEWLLDDATRAHLTASVTQDWSHSLGRAPAARRARATPTTTASRTPRRRREHDGVRGSPPRHAPSQATVGGVPTLSRRRGERRRRHAAGGRAPTGRSLSARPVRPEPESSAAPAR